MCAQPAEVFWHTRKATRRVGDLTKAQSALDDRIFPGRLGAGPDPAGLVTTSPMVGWV